MCDATKRIVCFVVMVRSSPNRLAHMRETVSAVDPGLAAILVP